MKTFSDRPEALRAQLDAVRDSLKSEHLTTSFGYAVGGLAISAVFGAIAESLALALLASFATLAAVLAMFFSGNRRLDRLDFVQTLCDALRPEIRPGSRLKLQYDDAATDTYGNVARTARSAAGNTKLYYKHRWMRLSGALPDGSRFYIGRKAFMKSKKGGIVRDFRYLSVRLQMPAGAKLPSGTALNGLRRLVRAAAAEHFHNPPEEIHVHPHLADGALRVKIVQHDAEFRADEVIAILEALLRFGYQHAKRVHVAGD